MNWVGVVGQIVGVCCELVVCLVGLVWDMMGDGCLDICVCKFVEYCFGGLICLKEECLMVDNFSL